MKKRLLFASITLLSLSLSPQKASIFENGTDVAFTFDLSEPRLKIVQFADLHLTYGFDHYDHKTLQLMSNIVKAESPDLIVLTGDQTLSLFAPSLYKKLTQHLESLETPWTFVFGNHDNDFQKYERILKFVSDVNPQYLFFNVGPEAVDGYGNFRFNYYYESVPFYNLYFLDSHAELKKRETGALSRYEYLSTSQVSWFKDKINVDATENIKSSVFMHIPLVEYLDAREVGAVIETGFAKESISVQGKNTGLFTAMKNSGVSEAVFVGHDHRNNFVFRKDNIILAYGQNSGYNAYGNMRRGARIITIENDHLSTYIVYGDEYEG